MSAEHRLTAWATATALLFGLAGPGSAYGQEATPARELALPPLPPQLAPAADAAAAWNADLRALRDRLADPRAEPLAHYLRYDSLNPIQIFAVEKPSKTGAVS